MLAGTCAALLRQRLGHYSSQLCRSVSSLVLAEHKQGRLSPTSLHAFRAAQELGGPVTALVAGRNIGPAAEAASRAEGIDKVLAADDAVLEHCLAEPMAALLVAVQKQSEFTHVLAPSSTFGRNILPRAAGLLDIQAVADVIEIKDADTFVRPIYAGNALATVRCLGEGARFLTVRPTAFPAAQTAPESTAGVPIEPVAEQALAEARSAAGLSEWVEDHVVGSARPELGQAKVVVAGGRALKSKENFAILEHIADLLGGAVGASRAAVDAGYAANDLQVGQTGKVVAPTLYIAVGISGAIQHVAGMKDSKVIVSINSDAEAPIFQISDYGLVGDLFKILPELITELEKLKAA